MRSQSTKTPRSTSPPRQYCLPDHGWRLQGIVRTHKCQVDYYQCQRCLAPRRDVRLRTPRRDAQR